MVDAVSTGLGGAADPRVATARTPAVSPAAPVAPTTGTTSPATSQAAAAPQIATLAKSMAAAAPVDSDRVAEIKQAIQNGTFPILPATIADQMMAMRYDWMQHDPA